jgi:hypothetical protein
MTEERLRLLIEFRFGRHHEVQALINDILKEQEREQNNETQEGPGLADDHG